MDNFLGQIKHFSVEPAVRNLYRNEEQKRLREQTAYNRSRDKLGDFRFDQRLKQQNEDRAYQRGRQVKADRRSDQMYSLKLGQMRERKAERAENKQHDHLARVAYLADTPEKWARMTGALKNKGYNFGDQYNDFASRESVLAEYGDLSMIKSLFKPQIDPLTQSKIELNRAKTLNFDKSLQSNASLNGFKDKKQKLSAQGDFRKEFNKVSGDYIKVRDAHSRVVASLENPSAAGDLAAIFNYMKVLDPGSTVREGEFATAQNAAGVPDIVRAQFNRLKNGEFLTPKQRGDFLNRSGLLFKKQEEQYNRNKEFYRGVAKRNGLDVRNVIPDLSIGKPPEKKVLKDQFSTNNIPKEVRDAAKRAIANGKSRESVLKFLREKYGRAE